jgi:probable rRNA maturation factor
MLDALSLEAAELSVLLVDDEGMQALNREHRNKDKPTDVLSFPQPKPRKSPPGMPRLLGDVVISLPTALRQARSRKRELMPEVRFLLAHGICHLVGHDHGTPEEKREMDAATRRLVRAALPATGQGRHAAARRTSSKSTGALPRQHRPAGRMAAPKSIQAISRPGKRPAKSRLT